MRARGAVVVARTLTVPGPSAPPSLALPAAGLASASETLSSALRSDAAREAAFWSNPSALDSAAARASRAAAHSTRTASSLVRSPAT
eukprot:1191424-Prorocentrum_minimum.AAC.5